MTLQLPEELAHFLQAQVQGGRFTSEEEAVTEAVRLLKQRQAAEEARALEGIRRGLEDMRHGRTVPVAEAFDSIRRELDLPRGT